LASRHGRGYHVKRYHNHNFDIDSVCASRSCICTNSLASKSHFDKDRPLQALGLQNTRIERAQFGPSSIEMLAHRLVETKCFGPLLPYLTQLRMSDGGFTSVLLWLRERPCAFCRFQKSRSATALEVSFSIHVPLSSDISLTLPNFLMGAMYHRACA
jgi:hypothetical protein